MRVGTTDPQPAYQLLNGHGLLAHVVASYLYPCGVLDEPVHERIDLNAGPDLLVPVVSLILRAA